VTDVAISTRIETGIDLTVKLLSSLFLFNTDFIHSTSDQFPTNRFHGEFSVFQDRLRENNCILISNGMVSLNNMYDVCAHCHIFQSASWVKDRTTVTVIKTMMNLG
jgi:hypothetical protein